MPTSRRPAASTLTAKVLGEHGVPADAAPGDEVHVRVDQALLHDVAGTMIVLELEAFGVEQVAPGPAVVYVDHNLLQVDERNADDHQFLRSSSARLGMHYSPAGTGISHPVHAQVFGQPGATLVGCDSHTPGAGALGMFAVAAGGLVVALTLAGEPFGLAVPLVWGVELVGRLPPWVSAKDVILELLRRHGVQGGNGRVVEYFGEGVEQLSVMDRQVIANMGTELGAVTSIFPSDDRTRGFLELQGREGAWRPLEADPGASYDVVERIDLSALVPLIARPHSPANVVPVEEVEGIEVGQVIVGSSANPGFRDIAVVAEMVKRTGVSPGTTLDVNPASRRVTIELAEAGHWTSLAAAGVRLNQAGCLGCCGMGQAPASSTVSLRTFPRNFRGRSGVEDDQVYLCSPETAAAAAATGRITDPRRLAKDRSIPYLSRESGRRHVPGDALVQAPPVLSERGTGPSARGPHIKPLPPLAPLPATLRMRIALKLDDDVSTDDIMPAGAAVLALRSDVPAISRYCFRPLDPTYADRVADPQFGVDHAIIAGRNYGQGSAREHAALAPRYLGLRAVVALSFARILAQNLASWGIVPLMFASHDDYDGLEAGDTIVILDAHEQLVAGNEVQATVQATGAALVVHHALSPEQVEAVRAGGVVAHVASARNHQPSRAGGAR